ncbi:class I adenylate-forming enzyme family protein [Pseudonocardia sulfidoxydans]
MGQPNPDAASLTLGEAMRSAVAAHGDLEMVVSQERRMTFTEVDAASRNLAGRLLAAGVGKGTRVGLFFTYGHEWVVCFLAAVRIGALAMPLSTLSTPAELGALVRRGNVDTLLAAGSFLGRRVADELAEALPAIGASGSPELAIEDAPYLRRVWLTGDTAPTWASLLDLDAAPGPGRHLVETAEQAVVPADLAVVVHTSGSTAEPKGVVHTHGSVLRGCVPIRDDFRVTSSGDPARVLCAMPFFWVGGVLTVVSAVLAPATLLTMPRVEPGEGLRMVEQERASHLMGWSTVTQSMRSHPDFATRDLRSLPHLLEGPAEIALIDVPVPGVPRHRGMSETMGTFAGVETRVVDPTTGERVAAGTEGELHVRGPGLMNGYYNHERHEVLDPDGWYATGDRAYLLDGYPTPFYVGRFSEMIKTAGANVAPREVELALEALPEIKHGIVVGLESADRGEEVVAVVVTEDGHDFERALVVSAARRELAPYKVPTRWFVTATDRIPWLGSGKPDKPALRAELRSGALDADEVRSDPTSSRSLV